MKFIFEGNYDWRFLISLEFFLGYQVCIYSHSIFVEQIKLIFLKNICKCDLVLFNLIGENTTVKIEFKMDIT
jgi:hypothetical protein